MTKKQTATESLQQSHAIFYHGPFEVNFVVQQPGSIEYKKLDGSSARYLGPEGVSGLRFGQMEKAGSRKIEIVRIQSDFADVCLQHPIPSMNNIGPKGAWVSADRATEYLRAAISANPGQETELASFWALLPCLSDFLEVDSDDEAQRLISAAPDGADVVSDTDRLALVQARRGQGRFRNVLIGLWRSCAVTGCSKPAVLRASHLKPWNLATNAERLDLYNGLLLSPNLDAVLDCGLITFTDQGRIIISRSLSTFDRETLSLHMDMKLRFVDARHLPFLQYHRDHVFSP